MTTAEQRYCGEEGTDYWQRNGERLDAERKARVSALRSLVGSTIAAFPWLEVGCGRGHNLLPGDVGLDYDARQLRHLPWGVIPIVGHAYDLSMFPDESFEVVFSVGCLMHLPAHCAPNSTYLTPVSNWENAVREMARVSRRYVILGEYWAEQEEAIAGKHWEGCLWRRPYAVPGFTMSRSIQPLAPFDTDVRFTLWAKQ